MVGARLAALEDMAAAARPPGASDARVPCPLCGGLIHPVAGRCKHCKQDLSALRGTRPQASAPLPALDTKSTPIPIAPPAPDAPPILPPRPTGRSVTAQPAPRSAWRSWPVIVIVFATAAIGAAVVIMVWPASSDAGKKHALQPPPAPERMETQPLPPPPAQAPDVDPWGPPAPRHGQLAPVPVPKDPLDDDSFDPFASLHGNGPAGLGGAGASEVARVIGKHLCSKLASCGGDLGIAGAMCAAYATAPATVPHCPASDRCIHAIDQLTCDDANPAAAWQLMQTLQDCMEARDC